VFLEESSPIYRLPYGPPEVRDFAELAGLVLASLLGFVAYRRKRRALGLVAAVIGAICVPVMLRVVPGLILFPTLFWAWWRNAGKGYGWALVGTIALSAAVVYWRIPQPTPMPPGPLREGTAVVRQVRAVNQIWTGASEGEHTGDAGGQGIRQPFQMLDLEFTPAGANEPIHVLDRVDVDSLPGWHEGAKVTIYYAATDPRLARAAGGTRTYARQAVVYLLGLTYGMGAALAFLVCPAVYVVGKCVRSSRIFGPIIASYEIVKYISRLPADDPRQKVLEAGMCARHDHTRSTAEAPSVSIGPWTS
jgi:hypothetical protein